LSRLLDLASERQCHVVAFDRPGFGYSDRPRGAMWTPARQADVLRQAFARLGIERPVVVGHSLGTLVALALALDHPDAVGGLVLLSGYYRPTLRADVPLSSLPAIPIIGDLIPLHQRRLPLPRIDLGDLPIHHGHDKTRERPEMKIERSEHALVADSAGIFRGTFVKDIPEMPQRLRLPHGNAPCEPPQQGDIAYRHSEEARAWSILAGAPVERRPVQHVRDRPHPRVIGSRAIDAFENRPVIE